MASAWDGIPDEPGLPYVLASSGGFRVGRSRVGRGHVGSGAPTPEGVKTVGGGVPIQAAARSIGQARLASYYSGLDGFLFPDVPPGLCKLELYFADFEAAGAGENVMTVTVNGVEVVAGMDPYALAGADTEWVQPHTSQHAGGNFLVELAATAGHTFLNDATLLRAVAVPVPPPIADPGSLTLKTIMGAQFSAYPTAQIESELGYTLKAMKMNSGGLDILNQVGFVVPNVDASKNLVIGTGAGPDPGFGTAAGNLSWDPSLGGVGGWSHADRVAAYNAVAAGTYDGLWGAAAAIVAAKFPNAFWDLAVEGNYVGSGGFYGDAIAEFKAAYEHLYDLLKAVSAGFSIGAGIIGTYTTPAVLASSAAWVSGDISTVRPALVSMKNDFVPVTIYDRVTYGYPGSDKVGGNPYGPWADPAGVWASYTQPRMDAFSAFAEELGVTQGRNVPLVFTEYANAGPGLGSSRSAVGGYQSGCDNPDFWTLTELWLRAQPGNRVALLEHFWLNNDSDGPHIPSQSGQDAMPNSRAALIGLLA
jgi:hypothetical protein